MGFRGFFLRADMKENVMDVLCAAAGRTRYMYVLLFSLLGAANAEYVIPSV